LTWNRTRLGGWALIIGTNVATIGYLAAGTLVHGHCDARFTSSIPFAVSGPRSITPSHSWGRHACACRDRTRM
jgi:hypothetical protein